MSSFANCSRIVVLDDGHIAAFGTEEELLETCDLYRDVYDTQNSAGYFADFDNPPEPNYDPVSQRYDPAFYDKTGDPIDFRIPVLLVFVGLVLTAMGVVAQEGCSGQG